MGGNPRYGEQCWLLLLPACQRALPQQPSNVRDCIALPYIYENRTSRGKTQQTGEAPSLGSSSRGGACLTLSGQPCRPRNHCSSDSLSLQVQQRPSLPAGHCQRPQPRSSRCCARAAGLSQFMHFSVDPFTSIEHNCVGSSGECIPASAFDPTDVDTDQW